MSATKDFCAANFWAEVRFNLFIFLRKLTFHAGYKVGRVDQAETALGAEMRLAADKSKPKGGKPDGKDKIVRR